MRTVDVEAVIFDLDGTLIDFEGASHAALASPLERRGLSFSWGLHGRIVGTRVDHWSRAIVEATGIPLTPEAYAAEYFDEIEGRYADIAPWDGTLALLAALRGKGFPLAIATSSPRASFDKKMAHHPEILSAINAVVTGDEVARGKPSPDIFLEAARRLGCDPARCVVFEDAPSGIEGAQAAGCYTVALPDGRMPASAARLHALSPTWTLPDGIGKFDPDCLRLVPRAPQCAPGEGSARAAQRATGHAGAEHVAGVGGAVEERSGLWEIFDFCIDEVVPWLKWKARRLPPAPPRARLAKPPGRWWELGRREHSAARERSRGQVGVEWGWEGRRRLF